MKIAFIAIAAFATLLFASCASSGHVHSANCSHGQAAAASDYSPRQ